MIAARDEAGRLALIPSFAAFVSSSHPISANFVVAGSETTFFAFPIRLLIILLPLTAAVITLISGNIFWKDFFLINVEMIYSLYIVFLVSTLAWKFSETKSGSLKLRNCRIDNPISLRWRIMNIIISIKILIISMLSVYFDQIWLPIGLGASILAFAYVFSSEVLWRQLQRNTSEEFQIRTERLS